MSRFWDMGYGRATNLNIETGNTIVPTTEAHVQKSGLKHSILVAWRPDSLPCSILAAKLII